jgi:hypothetical protein
MVDAKYRVVIDGLNSRKGFVCTELMDRDAAMTQFDGYVSGYFSADLRADLVRVSVLDEAEFLKRR